MQTSRLLTIAAASSLLVVGLAWNALEANEAGTDPLVAIDAKDNVRQLPGETRPISTTSYAAETHEPLQAEKAREEKNSRTAPLPSVVRHPSRPVAAVPVFRSTQQISRTERTNSSPTVHEVRSEPTNDSPTQAYETEFTPLYPPTQTGRIQTTPMILELDPGVRAPAAVLENTEALSPGQSKAKAIVAAEFAEEISKAVEEPSTSQQPDATPGVDEAAWVQAQREADERFRALFGDAAYNRASMQAAQESMR